MFLCGCLAFTVMLCSLVFSLCTLWTIFIIIILLIIVLYIVFIASADQVTFLHLFMCSITEKVVDELWSLLISLLL